MIKREELTNPASCMSRARDDEMTFVLLGRDPAAAETIRFWAGRRIGLGKNLPEDAQIVEALACADKMAAAQSAAAPAERLPVAEGSREQALADALQLVLDDWANSNSILDDAMDRAHAALAMPTGTQSATALNWRPHSEHPQTDEVFSALLAFNDDCGGELEPTLYGLYVWRNGAFISEDDGKQARETFWWIPEREVTASVPAAGKEAT